MTANEFETRFLMQADKEAWRALFDGYAEFYRAPVNDVAADEVWRWLLDPRHVLEGLIVCDSDGKALGFAHVRACPSTLRGGEIGFLDDFYVAPEARGSGAADALFAALPELASERGWQTIRWITQHFNERARAFYDRYTAGPSEFIVYQWAPRY